MRPFKIFKDGEKHTDAEKEDIAGPVKQVMHVLYKAHIKDKKVVQGAIESDRHYKSENYVLTFSKAGMILKEDLYGSDGEEISIYNELNQILSEVHYDEKKCIYQTKTYSYNEQGKSLGYTTVDKNGNHFQKTVNRYDEKGNHVETLYYFDKEEKVTGRHLYTYDEKGNKLSETDYDREEEIAKITSNKYNDRGNRTELKVEQIKKNKYTTDGYRVVYNYNEHGDLIEMVHYKADGSFDKKQMFKPEYDSNGKKIEKEHHYDPFALEAGQTEKVQNDHYGNWIKKTRFHNEKPVNIYVRQITYFDDAEDKELLHPLAETENDDIFITDVRNKIPQLDDEQVKWLASAPNVTSENFPALYYYLMRFKEFPSVTTYEGPHIESRQLAETLQKEMQAEVLYSSGNIWKNNSEQVEGYTLGFLHYPYLLQAVNIEPYSIDEFLLPEFIDEYYSSSLFMSDLKLLRPGDDSENRDEYFEQQLSEYIQQYSLEKKPDKPVINIIQVSNNTFSTKEYPVEDNFEIRDLDVNYGYGFEKFHKDLMSRFNNSTKGLVLFHGEPGTGKTYYIRHLLRSMVSNKKIVLYLPPNMVDHLVEPVFMTFLSSKIKAWSDAGNFCVLLIEDAEPLLAKRQEGVRIQGITNLLNMSDGLLNDMLNLQIICTFNVGLRKLDSALLRPGRLIARKEFKALSELDANLLAQRIGIKHHFTKPATLGEIYAMKKDQSILIHDVDSDENSSTIIDDLI